MKCGSYSQVHPFTLETEAGKAEYGPVSLLEHAQGPSLFSQKLYQLKNGKLPGPDGIHSQLLKPLPQEVHQKRKFYAVRRDNGNAPYGLNVARGN